MFEYTLGNVSDGILQKYIDIINNSNLVVGFYDLSSYIIYKVFTYND